MEKQAISMAKKKVATKGSKEIFYYIEARLLV